MSDAITATVRTLMAVLQPLTGERSSGVANAQSSGGTVALARGQYMVPVIGGQVAPEMLFKVAANPAEADGHWDVGPAATPVAVISNLGGARHNVPDGTEFVLDPPVSGLAGNMVASGDFTNGADSVGFGALRQLVDSESMQGPLLSRDVASSGLTAFPSAAITWTQLLPADGSSVPQVRPAGRAGAKKKLYRLELVVTVVSSRAEKASVRTHEGRFLTGAITVAVSDRQSCDGEVLSSPSGAQVQSVVRRLGQQDVFKRFFVYEVLLNCEVTLSGLDERTFAEWLRSRVQVYKPDEELGPIRVVPPED